MLRPGSGYAGDTELQRRHWGPGRATPGSQLACVSGVVFLKLPPDRLIGSLLYQQAHFSKRPASLPATGRGQPAGVNRQYLAEIGLSQNLYTSDPFDPFEAAPTRGNQSHRRSVIVA
jgi:hypothetical protein